ncbi:metaxin-1 homolog [Toxorhynchites rutilus septentrionalis]|uniref:metaxin-1 homolog n=1 Tax=Toxorhynchites rutilus septentrionalis TaxID=329112 RepID=UPI00247AF8F1|nr:metaxin-1 homolog [Toxorhynchites rutilus septentrionalis]
MELFLYRGEWGLPSIDYDCARILAYLKFSETKITYNFNGNPFSSPSGMLPYLVTEGRKKIAGYSNIVEYLQSIGCDANAQLENQSYIVINGYIQYVLENLHPFFMYTLWGDPQNLDTTRTLYAKRIPIPFNFYCPRKYVLKTNELTQTLAGFGLEDSVELHDVKDLIQNAKKCINWVASKLGESRFFFGDTPSEIDAVLYGYFSVILKLTLPNNVLQNHLKQCEKLVSFTERITTIYFAKEGFTSAKVLSSASSNSSSSSSNSKPKEEEKQYYDGTQKDDTPYDRKKRYVVSGIFATFAMVGYALMSGILTIAHPANGGGNFISYDEPEYDDED